MDAFLSGVRSPNFNLSKALHKAKGQYETLICIFTSVQTFVS